jgi:hypothetical protein
MMERGAYRFILIMVMIAAVAILHFIPVAGQWGVHYLHREFFFLPLFLAAFWFGA